MFGSPSSSNEWWHIGSAQLPHTADPSENALRAVYYLVLFIRTGERTNSGTTSNILDSESWYLGGEINFNEDVCKFGAKTKKTMFAHFWQKTLANNRRQRKAACSELNALNAWLLNMPQASYIGDVPGTFYFILFYFNILNTAPRIMSSLSGPTGQWAYHIHIPIPSPTTSTTRSWVHWVYSQSTRPTIWL